MTVLKAKFDLTLEIDGTDGETRRFPLVYFEGSWALNQIPAALCVLAAGRDALSGDPSPVHEYGSTHFRRMLPARVRFSAQGEYAQGLQWPDGEFTIFEGRVLGLAPQKTSNQIQISVQLVHWLADLDFSSAVSAQHHVANPTQYTFEAVMAARITTGLETGLPYGLAQQAEAQHIDSLTVAEDLWGQALKPLFCALARGESLELDSELSLCLGEADGVNTQALAALARIEGASGRGEDGDCDLERSAYTPPLALTLNSLSPAAPLSVAEAISSAIGQQLVLTFLQQSMWGKLVGELGPMFSFSLVPQVERALVVPFTPGLRTAYCKKLRAVDYDFFVPSIGLARPLRAVAVLNNYKSDTGYLTSRAGQDATYVGLGGCYAPPDSDLVDGLVYLISPPPWLLGVLSTPYRPDRSAGTDPELPPSSSTTPVAIDEQRQANQDGLTSTELLLGTKDLYDAFAHSRYVAESLRGRTAQLGGKLRFDIAPGATVRIEGSSDPFVAAIVGSDDTAANFYGSVLRVSIGINAESGKAGTGFLLGHVRYEDENESDKTSVTRHPLYNTIFTGAPLHPQLAFPEESVGCPF